MHFRALFVVGVMCVCAGSVFGRGWSNGLEKTATDGNLTMPYRVYLPAGYDPAQQYPLVLFLHGAGERGTDNDKQVKKHISGLIDKTESDYPAILVAPQVPGGSGWLASQDLTAYAIDDVQQQYSVDSNRMYITGLSMGGFGSFGYSSVTEGMTDPPFRFAASAPLSGGHVWTADPSMVAHFNHVPHWIMHGSNDSTVDVRHSRETYKSLVGMEETDSITFNTQMLGYPTATSGNIRYTEFTGKGHNIWSPIYSGDEFYEWMFSHEIPEPTTAILMTAAVITLVRRRS